jgi:hypothetical protein
MENPLYRSKSFFLCRNLAKFQKKKKKKPPLENMSDGLENWTYKYLQSNVFIWKFLMRPEWRLSVERDQLSGVTCESTGHMVNNDQSYLKRVR